MLLFNLLKNIKIKLMELSFFENFLSILRDVVFEMYYSFLIVLRNFLEIYKLAVDLRIVLGWFLNINPYMQPVSTLWKITNPIMFIGRDYWPRVFGGDITFQYNLRILDIIISGLTKLIKRLTPLHDLIVTENYVSDTENEISTLDLSSIFEMIIQIPA